MIEYLEQPVLQLEPEPCLIHPTACVDDPAALGPGTQVWHFCHVMRDAKLGAHCRLGQNVFLASSVVGGKNVKIQNNVSLYAGCRIEDDVFCGPSCVFINVLNPHSAIPRRDDHPETLVCHG